MKVLQLSKGTERFLKYGAPFLIFVVCGSYGLKEFTDIRVKKREEKVRKLTADESFSFLKKSDESLSDIYESMSKKIEAWDGEQIRGPRPWEAETMNQGEKRKQTEGQ